MPPSLSTRHPPGPPWSSLTRAFPWPFPPVAPQAGGCCDCGDEDAWDAAGFCNRHGSHGDDPLSHLPPPFNASARAVLKRTVDFIVTAVEAYVASYDLGLAGTQPWGGPHDDYYLLLHNDDVHTLKCVPLG